jgi:hypothetical protein
MRIGTQDKIHPMDRELPSHQVAKLAGIAAQTGRGTDELVRQAVNQLLTED